MLCELFPVRDEDLECHALDPCLSSTKDSVFIPALVAVNLTWAFVPSRFLDQTASSVVWVSAVAAIVRSVPLPPESKATDDVLDLHVS